MLLNIHQVCPFQFGVSSQFNHKFHLSWLSHLLIAQSIHDQLVFRGTSSLGFTHVSCTNRLKKSPRNHNTSSTDRASEHMLNACLKVDRSSYEQKISCWAGKHWVTEGLGQCLSLWPTGQCSISVPVRGGQDPPGRLRAELGLPHEHFSSAREIPWFSDTRQRTLEAFSCPSMSRFHGLTQGKFNYGRKLLCVTLLFTFSPPSPRHF